MRYVDNHLLVVEKPAGMLSQADITGDEDILTAMKAWVGEHFNKPGFYSEGDISFNGHVDLEDFSIFRRAYAAANAPAAASAVPEPSAQLMTLLGMLVLPVLLRRRVR